MGPLFYFEDGNPSVSDDAIFLTLNSRERSRYYRYSGPAPLTFYTQGVDEDGNTVFNPACQSDFSAQRGKWLVMIEKSRVAGALPFRGFSMEFDEDSFPEGSLLFYNATGAKFHGILGRQSIEINPGPNRALDISEYYEDEIPVGLVVKDGDQIRKVLASKMRFFPERRTLMILRAPKREGSFRVQAQKLTEYMGKFDDRDPGA